MLLAYAAQRDIDQERLCRLSGINLQHLLTRRGMPVTPMQQNKLWDNAAHLSGDPLFGLHFGASAQLAALGVVGAVIGSSATVGEAISLAAGMTPLLTNLFTLDAEQKSRFFTLNFRPAKGVDTTAAAFRQVLDFFMVFTVQELDGLLLAKVQPDAVYMGHGGDHVAAYEQAFRCRPVQRKGQYVLRFPRALWNEQILTADYETQAWHMQQVQALLQQGPAGATATKVYTYLMANAYLGIPPLEAVAAGFNLSARSLQRKLKEEGTGYQQVADQVRLALAAQYLSSGAYPVKEISGLLGYNEVSAFTRAFKKWTGVAPSAYTG